MITKPYIYSNWRTQDGRSLNIKEVEISHLKNCAYKMVRDNWRIDLLQLFVEELRNRKEDKIADEVMSIFKMNSALE